MAKKCHKKPRKIGLSNGCPWERVLGRKRFWKRLFSKRRRQGIYPPSGIRLGVDARRGAEE